MTAREVAKWHGKSCIVTLKQGSVLQVELLDKNCGFGCVKLWLTPGIRPLILAREIKSIKAREK